MKKLTQLLLPVILFASVLYLCVFSVFHYQRAETAARLSAARTTVVLDPGHGGEDGGATGVSGASEAALNLEISLRLRDFLSLAGIRSVMIRETDTAVYEGTCHTISEKKVSDLKQRVKLVNGTENALLVSIHQNFFTEGKYHGAQVFYAKTSGSRQLAERLQQTLAEAVDPQNRRQCKKSTSVYLMEHISCTGILLECGFLSNYAEEQQLCTAAYQKRLSAAVAGTVSAYLAEERTQREI